MAEENIYNMVPVVKPVVPTPQRYKSTYNPKMPPSNSTFTVKSSMRGSMGKPLGTNKPDGFMVRGGGRRLGNGTTTEKCQTRVVASKRFAAASVQKKPGVPNRKDRPVMGLQSTKNYTTANAVEAILAVPGNRAKVVEQQPRYTNKVDYGKVPAYLNDVKAEISRENEMIQQYLSGDQQETNDYDDDQTEVGHAELCALVDALKRKWDATNKQYQKMCHMVKLDTVGKVRRKEDMESTLKQLEDDIERLEREKDKLERQ